MLPFSMANRSSRNVVLAALSVLSAACSGGSGDAGSSSGDGAEPAFTGAADDGSGPGATVPPPPAAVPGGGEPSNPTDVPLAPSPSVPGAAVDTPSETPASEAPPSEVPPLEGDIRFSEPSGSFQGTLQVGIETPIEGATIRYTLDGSVPGPDATVYDGTPVVVGQTRQIRAQAYLGDVAAGAPGTALYVARSVEVSSDLPLIIVEGYGAGKPGRDAYVDMAFMVFEPLEGVASLSNPPTLVTRGGYHLRGQSSATFDQAPYRVELWDNASEDADYPVLGMPAEADWALIGPYVDRSLIRNAFVYDLGRDMGLPAPRYAFAEVYIDQDDGVVSSADYQGIYMLTETIENDSARLDLSQLHEGDTAPDVISGGYIFKFEWAASEAPTLACTGSAPLGGGFGVGGMPLPTATPGAGLGAPAGGGTCWTDLEVVDPEPLAPAQADYLTSYVQQFHDSLHTAPLATYGQYVDIASFVDVFIINELTRNLDAYTRSAYYYKDRDQPLRAGPLWDFNLTLGMGFGTNLETVGWQFEDRNVASDWFRILGTDPEFVALVSLRWRELRQTLLSREQLDQRISALIAPLAGAAPRDFQRWPVAEVAQGIFQIPTDPTWDGQIQVIRDWLGERLAWLDSQLP
jgi:CotH protein/chitobiase/beta-hexosaminidase-like protein